MMYITVGRKDIELKTNLAISYKMEQKTKKSITDLLGGIDRASIKELAEMLSFGTDFASGSAEWNAFFSELLENWDYADLQLNAQKFLAQLLFSGTPEEVAKKIDAYPMPEDAKNAMRGLMGIPIPEAPETAAADSAGSE